MLVGYTVISITTRKQRGVLSKIIASMALSYYIQYAVFEYGEPTKKTTE